MKHSLPNKDTRFLYLEPYTFSVMAGNDVLIYNSLNGKILEYRDSPSIVEIIRKTEDAGGGFLAEIDRVSARPEISSLISDLRENFCGDLISLADQHKPSVIRPKAIIKNYPPAKDFPSFSADDYLRTIYFFLNQNNNKVCTDYRFAASQFVCPVFNSQGYSEMPFETVVKTCSQFAGVSGMGIDLSGSDLTAYSEINFVLKRIHKLQSRVNFHLPLPCYDQDIVSRLLKVGNSRTSIYITFPDGPSALKEIRINPEYIKKQNRIDLNFLIRSMEEYQVITELLQGNGKEKVFFFPYFNGRNADFFKENVFLARNDILALKPNQKQIYSRSLINEHLYGKIFIKTGGEAYANLNHDPLGNINKESISDLVRNELYNGKSWGLTRLKVKPCGDCLYQLFCPPIGNYELFMKRFNFCDVL
ncbi:MAG: TIGR04150 pseudo-rSAM protein [Bacteroidetes bacterium]|nr:TIGR04150 pseudo-rSAM protein [Bacteroidota bacterium]